MASHGAKKEAAKRKRPDGDDGDAPMAGVGAAAGGSDGDAGEAIRGPRVSGRVWKKPRRRASSTSKATKQAPRAGV